MNALKWFPSVLGRPAVAVVLWFSAESLCVAVAGNEHWDNQFGPPGLNGNTLGVAVIGNKVYAVGGFTAAGNIKTAGVAGFDGTNWFPLNGGLPYPGGGTPIVVCAMADSNC